MAERRKIFLWLTRSIVIVLALVVGLLFFIPLCLNSLAVKEKLQATLSRQLGSAITYKRLDLSLVPLPHVTIVNLGLSVPEEVAVSLKSLSIYPKVLPLLKGKIVVSKIEMREPDFRLVLRERPVQTGPVALGGIRAWIRKALSSLNAVAPGLVVQIDQGTLDLYEREHRFISLKNIYARFAALPEGMNMALHARSVAWGAVALSGTWSFDEDIAGVQDLSGTLGQSSFSGLSARLTWKRPTNIEVLSGTALIKLEELLRWLRVINYPVAYLKGLSGLKGTLSLTSVAAKGPIARLSDWQWKIDGLAQNVVVETALLPAPLALSGSFFSEQNSIEATIVSASFGRSSLSRVFARIDWRKEPRIIIFSGRAVLALDEISAWRSRSKGLGDVLKDIQALSGTIRLSAISLKGPLVKPSAWQASLTGTVENITLDTRLLPGPVAITQGTFSLTPSRLDLTAVRASVRDTSFMVAGSLAGFPKGIDSADLTIDGSAGPEMVQWVFTTLTLPQKFLVNAPLSFAGLHLAWQRAAGASLVGKAIVAGGLAVDLDLQQSPGAFVIRKAKIKDQRSDADLSLRYHKSGVDLSFRGTLAQSTLNRLFASMPAGDGSIGGDLRASIQLDRLEGSTAEGILEGAGISFPWGREAAVGVNGFSLRAAEKTVTIDSAALTWEGNRYSLSGMVRAGPEGLVLDMDLGADIIEVKMIQQALEHRKEDNDEDQVQPFAKPVILGTIRVHSPSLLYDRFIFNPVRAIVTFNPDNVSILFSEAGTCGLSVPGTLVFSQDTVSLDLKPAAARQNLESAIKCLVGEKIRMSGDFDLSAQIRAAGKRGTLLSSLEGTVRLSAKDGKIYRYPLLAKVLSILSVTEFFRGKPPELGGSGFPYRSLIVEGELHQGKFVLERAFIDGSSVDLLAEGEVDIAQGKLDLVVLVAPFSTINWIVRHIPLVGKVMGGTLITIPVKVSGDLADPEVTFLAPSAVGKRLVEIMKNILQLPVEIVSPFLPREKETKK